MMNRIINARSLVLILLVCCTSFAMFGQNGFVETHKASMDKGRLEVFDISLDGKEFGSSVWFRRADNTVKARYFAADSPYQTFRSWRRSGHEILGICGGAYLGTDTNVGQGLSITDGLVVSRNFNPDIDGLVIIEEVGGIRVANLEKGPINVYYKARRGQPRVKRELDPKNPTELEELLTWAVEANATLFQTHLLAWKGKVKPDVFGNSEFKKLKSYKRFLALVYNDANELHFVIVDVNQNLPIGMAALHTTKYFLNHCKVQSLVALINLNRNGNEPMETYFNTQNITGLDSERTLEDAKNILVFYH